MGTRAHTTPSVAPFVSETGQDWDAAGGAELRFPISLAAATATATAPANAKPGAARSRV